MPLASNMGILLYITYIKSATPNISSFLSSISLAWRRYSVISSWQAFKLFMAALRRDSNNFLPIQWSIRPHSIEITDNRLACLG